MTLQEFRKLLQGCNSEAKVIFSVTSGVQLHNCEVSNVIEQNTTDDGKTTEPFVNVVLHIRKGESCN